MDSLTNILVEVLVGIVIVLLGFIGRIIVTKLNKIQEQQGDTTVELV